ncbi:TonB-dependent receptor domain-containing protein [Carboxylicivirga sp. N1Y90]|uniref:TonB-dependent receptor n=1 Tax=Carboxylicivirga fragile TaxID=3417571 RepID=UPI003D349BE9|nr:TonB-dependent receptor [Marinilabiliaceae bacterium N1Y90]
MKKNIVVISILLLACIAQVSAQTGILKGKITDSKTGEELVGTAIVIDGTTVGTITNFMGEYEMPPLEPGTYNIRVQYISYEPQLKEGVVIKEGEPTVLDFQLGSAEMDLDEVTVVAKANRESENFLMLEQKKASVIKESIGAKRMSALGISDAEDATGKISGVSMNDATGDVFIRGLGDRYLTTTMNGLPIPSDDVERKNIDLDLFSTDVIQNIGVSKTYTVANYGDLTSGAVDITSKAYTEKVTLGIKGGANTNVFTNGVFSNFKTTQNFGDQTLGYYSAPYSTIDAVQKQSWNTNRKSVPLNYGVSILGGKKVKLFDKDLSIFGTISQSVSSEYRTGLFKAYRSNVLNTSYSDVEEFETEYNTTGLLNFVYDINTNHSINFNSLFVHKTTDNLYESGRNGEGFQYDQDPQEENAFVRDQNLKQTTLFINQLLGRHSFNDKNLLKWGLGYNTVHAEEPNRIRNQGNIVDDNRFAFAYVGDYQQKKSLQNIEDAELNGYITDEYKFVDEEYKKLKVDFGANFRQKQRDFNSKAVGVLGRGVSVESVDNVDEVLLDESLYEDGTLRIRDGVPDLYDGKLLVFAGFASFGFDVNKVSGNVGARYEMNQLDVNWDVANYQGPNGARIGGTSNSYNNVLPAINFKYQINEKSAFRLAASKTVTLPEFKEIAPFEYVSPTGRVTKGNPDLKSSQNYNFDLKWEMYPSAGQLFSATGFYKQINDPINRAQTRGSSGYFYFANTGEQATVYGLEVETRLDLIKATESEIPSLNLSLNATRMWFSQDLLEDFQYNNKTEANIEGASEFIFNGALSYADNKAKGFMATLSGNYSSDKVFALGAPEDKVNSSSLFNNEIIEKGFVTLDLVLSKKISNRVSLKFTGKNLLNPNIKQTQVIEPINDDPTTTEVVSSYKKGLQLSLGINIDLN